MPIYDYKCSSCAYSDDLFLKLSDAVTKNCPACGKKTFEKKSHLVPKLVPKIRLNNPVRGRDWKGAMIRNLRGHVGGARFMDHTPYFCLIKGSYTIYFGRCQPVIQCSGGPRFVVGSYTEVYGS